MKRERVISARSAEGEIAGLAANTPALIRRILLGRGVRDAAEISLELSDMERPDSLGGLAEASTLLDDAVF